MERKLSFSPGFMGHVDKVITTSGKCFIIAEIGQNHQGNIEVAKRLIGQAKWIGADCVKFQKTCINEKFNLIAQQRPYVNRNAFASPYGKHKKHLEFSEDEFWQLQAFADKLGIMFAATAMDIESCKFLIRMKLPFIKIGSGDVNNPLLIEEAAKSNIALIISTGMSNINDVTRIYDCVKKYHTNFALLHCVSAYPTPPAEANLKVIKLYEEQFPDVIIGYSGHEVGMDITLAAVAMGAKIIERHITVDKSWRGSDHVCSLEVEEFGKMVEKIRTIEKALGHPTKMIYACETSALIKLRKVIVMNRPVSAGHTLRKKDLAIKVADPPGGLDGNLLYSVIGQKVNVDVVKDEPLMPHYLGEKPKN